MGYDMSWKTPDAEEVAAVAELRQKLEAAESLDDRLWVYKMIDDVQKSYFRLNIWGMMGARGAMCALGMVDEAFEHSEFTGNDEQDEMVVQEFDEAVGLPPLFKFGSNDGWLVSPAEIKNALAMYDRLSESECRSRLMEVYAGDEVQARVEYFEEFIEFWRGAETHGGFEVH